MPPKRNRQIDLIEWAAVRNIMVDEIDETPTPDPESEPPADGKSRDVAVADDDGLEEDGLEDEQIAAGLI